MPFGLIDAPATFMTLMDNVLQPYLGKFMIVFLDDILIYNLTQEEHIKHLKMVFKLLQENQLFAKRKANVNFLR